MRQPTPGVASPVRWTDCLQTSRPEQPPLIGLVRGEGVGPEVIAAALEVLSAITDSDTLTIEACEDVEVGKRAEKKIGRALPDAVINFCEGHLRARRRHSARPGGRALRLRSTAAVRPVLQDQPAAMDLSGPGVPSEIRGRSQARPPHRAREFRRHLSRLLAGRGRRARQPAGPPQLHLYRGSGAPLHTGGGPFGQRADAAI